jgi:hypothetical protein
MRQLYLSITFLFSAFTGFAQQDTVFVRYASDYDVHDMPTYTTDTIVFPVISARQILVGTTVIPWSHNSMTVRGTGYLLTEVKLSPCNSDLEPDYNDHIESIRQTDSTLEIDIAISDNCCYSFLCDASVDSNNVMHLMYTGYGNYCACDCCFGLTYVFENMHYDDVQPLDAVMIDTLPATMKKLRRP